jgi:para-nitrobenzyl esterase
VRKAPTGMKATPKSHRGYKAPGYRYLFAHPHPRFSDYQLDRGNLLQILLKKMINRIIKGSSFHAAEIAYAMGNLAVQPIVFALAF